MHHLQESSLPNAALGERAQKIGALHLSLRPLGRMRCKHSGSLQLGKRIRTLVTQCAEREDTAAPLAENASFTNLLLA